MLRVALHILSSSNKEYEEYKWNKVAFSIERK